MTSFIRLAQKAMLISVISLCSSACGLVADDVADSGKTRIGTYDSRAIAIAHAASSFNPVNEKMKTYQQAKADGNEALVKELENWGKTYQKQLHFQGFGRVPVSDLLQPLQEQVAALASSKNLAVIAMQCDFVGESVTLVDVTDDLVKLFQPSEKTLENVRQIRQQQPVSLAELAEMDHNH